MFTPSTASLPALTRLIVVSVACHTSSVPTPRASVVESTTHASGNPVQFVRVQLVGVPSNGVVRVGLVANTRTQVPVLSLITHASCVEVVDANCCNQTTLSALSVFKLLKLSLITVLDAL